MSLLYRWAQVCPSLGSGSVSRNALVSLFHSCILGGEDAQAWGVGLGGHGDCGMITSLVKEKFRLSVKHPGLLFIY